MPSIFDRLTANPANHALVQLAADIDAEAAAAVADTGATTATEEVPDEVVAERLEIAEEAVADAEIAIEIRGDLEAADKIIIDIAKDDDTAEVMDEALDNMTETVVTTESFLKDGGMSAQTAQEHMRNLKRLCSQVGFQMPATLPTFESFGGSASRYDATNMVFLEEQKWWQKLWATIKGFLKTSWDTMVKFIERIVVAAERTKARAAKLYAAAVKRKGTPKNAKVTLGTGITAYTGSNNLDEAAKAIADAAIKAYDAANERAATFNAAVITAMNGGSIDPKNLQPKAPAQITAPGGWGFKVDGHKATWERTGEVKESEVAVLGTTQLAEAAKDVQRLCDKLIEAKSESGKNAQGYKDAIKAGDNFEKSMASKDGADGAKKEQLKASLSKLKEARAAFVQPTNSILSYGAKAGAAVLDGIAKQLKEYGVAEAAKEEKAGAVANA